MSITLIQENGSAKVNANTYAGIADGDAYHEGHLYASAWTDADADKKAVALVMATRLIDTVCKFMGFRKSNAQALQWPRIQVPDLEAVGVYAYSGITFGRGAFAPQYFPNNIVPVRLVSATCELARELLNKDRTAEPVGQGLKSMQTPDVTFVFDKTDRPSPLTQIVWDLLRPLLDGSGGGGSSVRLVRT